MEEIAHLIEELDYESLKDEILTHLKEEFNEDYSFIESDSFSLVLEAFIYRELKLRARINQAIKDAFLIINTDDTNNTAGSKMAYKRAINEVDPGILDISITSSSPGVVDIVYHHAADITNDIVEYLNKDDIRPLTDTVYVEKASIVPTDVHLIITVLEGVDTSLLQEDINTSFDGIGFKIGENLTVSKVIATAFKSGVYKVITPFETTDINDNEVLSLNLSYEFEVLS